MSLLRKPAPHFRADSWYKDDFKVIDLKDYHGKYVVLFFYPLDFTFVCPTQIIAFNSKAKEFSELNCALLAVSVDSKFTHMEYTLKDRKNGGLGPMDIPLIADVSRKIATDYGCLCDVEDEGVAYRATYIIDPKGILRHSSINDLPVGRNPDEYLRLVKAFKYTDQHGGEVCPANWQPGKPVMSADIKSENYKNVIAEQK